MRIAIVDDIAPERATLGERLNGQLARLSLKAEILEYESGAEFLASAEKNKFDLVFLDIYMGNENGIDTAKALRQFDKDCLLILTTSSMDHALDGFRVRAVQYLVKPYSDKELADLFDEIAKRLPAPSKYIEMNISGSTIRLRFSEILYAEHYRHQIYIYTADGKSTVIRQTFREFTKALSDDRFFPCNRGIIVNLEHAADFDGSDFIMKNGKKLPVSRALSKAARLAFGDFLFKRGPGL